MRIWKWFIATTTNRLVWRVTYSNGQSTRLLSYSEAKSLKDCFTGKLWIDYDNGYF